MLNYLIRRWYNIGLVVALGAICWGIFGDISKVQVILLLNLVVLCWHQFEEMRWPGGSPWILNEVFNAQGGPADIYPLNQANCAFINVVAWFAYLVPVFYPDLIWLGIAQILFGMGQFVVHGIIINRKLKTFYNPGLAAVVLGHIPLGVWYLIEVYNTTTVRGWDWIFGILTLAAFIVICLRIIGYGLMVNRHSRFPFDSEEMSRWGRLTHLARAGITPFMLSTDSHKNSSIKSK